MESKKPDHIVVNDENEPDLTSEEFLKRFDGKIPTSHKEIAKMLEDYRDEFQLKGFWRRLASKRKQERDEAIALLQELSGAMISHDDHERQLKEKAWKFIHKFS